WNGNTVKDFFVNVFSFTLCQPNSSELMVSDDDKAGATLLFSGAFLGLVGITFTVMGWAKYEDAIRFEWIQLLGPILLSVGVTFLLIAVCKFKMLACKSCSPSEERASDMGQIPGAQSIVFTGISHPINFHSATVVQYIPSYSTQERISMNSANVHQVLSHSGIPPFSGPLIPASSPPRYFNVNPLDNSAFSADENPAYLSADTRSGRSTDSLQEPAGMLDEDICSDISPPPYEKLFSPLS
ncbi:transmembrane protein 174, partial [Rhineura floridana]|uniref:transmembrane protein 174 n=1 Tax=Rhineura floridana TaxID=261503 RepID=UPI002AC84B40